MHPELLRQQQQDRHISALATPGLGDEDHLLLKKQLVGLMFTNSGTLALIWNGVLMSSPLVPCVRYTWAISLRLSPQEEGDQARMGLRPFNGQGAVHFLGDEVGLIIREVALTPEFLRSRDDRQKAG
jgi:hypothetical protein